MKDKILIIAGLLITALGLFFLKFPDSLSRFTSSVSSDAVASIAFYVVDLGYQNAEVNLDKIVPSDEEYEYTFSVANYNSTKRLETNAEYNIIIRTTTNLNLEYKLYENDGSEDIFVEKTIEADNDGTYFNIMKTDKEYFGFTENQINNYTLKIKFPKDYMSFDYQDVIESIEIIVMSSQITD